MSIVLSDGEVYVNDGIRVELPLEPYEGLKPL